MKRYQLGTPAVVLSVEVDDAESNKSIGVGKADIPMEFLTRKTDEGPREWRVELWSSTGEEACGLIVFELETVRCDWEYTSEDVAVVEEP